MEPRNHFYAALKDFDRARRMATLQEILSRLTGQSTELLSYQDVRKRLRGIESANNVLKEIPLRAIVGSVGRYTDFTRLFLPRRTIDQQRWANVKSRIYSESGWDPIEVYQIGETYFVLDGNHRVSIARQSGVKFIQAYVREVKTEVPLSPKDKPDDIILKGEHADFLAITQIKQLIPDAEIRVTEPGRYHFILQQIDAIQFSRELKTSQEIPYNQAVMIWYKDIYLPVIDIIRDQNILNNFPGRTEADLFLWIIKYRSELEKSVGWQVQTSTVASELATHFSGKKIENLLHPVRVFLNRFAPGHLIFPSRAGLWRQRRMATREGRMFADILVIACKDDQICDTLEQALQIAWLEGSQIRGLFLDPGGQFPNTDQNRIELDFLDQCKTAKIQGEIIFESGNPRKILQNRIRLVDLVVLPISLLLPMESNKTLRSDFRSPLRRSVAPILIAQGDPQPFERVLLAYDGSPKSEQALFLSAFMATFWEVQLDVISILDKKRVTPEAIQKARAFLDHYAIQANFFEKTGETVPRILEQISKSQSHLLILGGYDAPAIVDVLSVKILDQILPCCEIPILICN